MKKHLIYSLCMSAALMAAACADDKGTDPAPDPNPDPVPEEYYAGGKLGTAFNTTSVAYEQPTPVVDDDAPAYAASFRPAIFRYGMTNRIVKDCRVGRTRPPRNDKIDGFCGKTERF